MIHTSLVRSWRYYLLPVFLILRVPSSLRTYLYDNIYTGLLLTSIVSGLLCGKKFGIPCMMVLLILWTTTKGRHPVPTTVLYGSILTRMTIVSLIILRFGISGPTSKIDGLRSPNVNYVLGRSDSLLDLTDRVFCRRFSRFYYLSFFPWCPFFLYRLECLPTRRFSWVGSFLLVKNGSKTWTQSKV